MIQIQTFNMVKKIGAGLCLAALLAMPVAPQAEAAVSLPEKTFQWVQSTSRQNYYFNMEQMCYAVNAQGHIDLNHLIVPTVRTYDAVQIEEPVHHYELLSSEELEEKIKELEARRNEEKKAQA